MFVIKEEAVYDWPVDVKVPSGKRPGHYDIERFTVTFNVPTPDEVEEMVRAAEEAPPAERDARRDDLLNRVVVGWKDVAGDDGEPVDFSAEALAAVLRWPWVRLALYQAYRDSVTGVAVKGRRLGN